MALRAVVEPAALARRPRLCCADGVSLLGPVLLLVAFFAVVAVACYLNEPRRRARRTNNGESAKPEDTGLGNGIFFQ